MSDTITDLLTAKVTFAEITSLSNKYGYCTASNGYFAKLYEVTKVTVSRRIANLKECGYLHVEIIRNGNEIKQKLYPLTEMIRPINTNDNTLLTILLPYYHKC